MSNQDMQFVDPEWQTSQQQGRNTNPPVTGRQVEPMQEPYIPRPINTGESGLMLRPNFSNERIIGATTKRPLEWVLRGEFLGLEVAR